MVPVDSSLSFLHDYGIFRQAATASAARPETLSPSLLYLDRLRRSVHSNARNVDQGAFHELR